MEEKIDRRVRKTKKHLREGLAKLLQEKPVKSITVREISDLVDINRGTFYLHYKDIYDMMEQIQDEMFEEFNAIIDAHRLTPQNATIRPMLKDIFLYLSDNAEMAKVFMSKNGDAFFVDRLKDVIKEKCFMNLHRVYHIKNKVEFDYYYSFIVSGCIGIFQLWLERDRKEPPDVMAALAERYILNGFSGIK